MDGEFSTQEHLEEIALDRIDPSPSNPRKRFDPQHVKELAAGQLFEELIGLSLGVVFALYRLIFSVVTD